MPAGGRYRWGLQVQSSKTYRRKAHSYLSLGPAVNVMVVLTGPVRRHGRHNFRWPLPHVEKNDIRRSLQRTRGVGLWFGWFSELLNPRLKRKPFRRGLRP